MKGQVDRTYLEALQNKITEIYLRGEDVEGGGRLEIILRGEEISTG